jgi:hypothetical protein
MNNSDTVYDYIVLLDSTIDNSTPRIGYCTLDSARNAVSYYVKKWFTSEDRPEDFLQELDSVPDTMTSWGRRLGGTDFRIVRQAVG